MNSSRGFRGRFKAEEGTRGNTSSKALVFLILRAPFVSAPGVQRLAKTFSATLETAVSGNFARQGFEVNIKAQTNRGASSESDSVVTGDRFKGPRLAVSFAARLRQITFDSKRSGTCETIGQ